ncbi:hypothetical protein [Filifactor villosus]|uniref:Uncharacterized protein n=1 Tax=Filifactor villosus TaxID=29374 RepID=A0ABV9QGZ9_9FIRM
MSQNIVGPTFPPLGDGTGEIFGIIIKVVKKLVDLFKKPSKEAGKTDSINNNSSLENIDRITQIFSDFKDQVRLKACEVESAATDEVNYYVDELHDILNDNADKVDKYGIRIKRIEKQINKISSRIKGTIDNELSRKVSLDNPECKEIVKMIPGSKKEVAMNTFLSSSVKEALKKCCSNIHENLDEIYEDVESEIIGAVESIQKENDHLKASLSAIDEDNYEVTARKQMIDAYFSIDACDIVLETL